MRLGVYSMRDALTGYSAPTVEQHDAVAIRNFTHAVLTSGSLFDTHASDFSLYHIGWFDSDTGKLTAFDAPELLITGQAIWLSSMDAKKEAQK